MTGVRVVALGQAVAGDDGVALRVVERFRARLGVEAHGVEFSSVADCSQLIELFCFDGEVWVVDAVVGAGRPGQVLSLDPEQLSAQAACSVSSHGLDAMQALQLCRSLYGELACPRVRVFAISIVAPRAYGQSLSDAVAAAVEPCVARMCEALQRGGRQLPQDFDHLG